MQNPNDITISNLTMTFALQHTVVRNLKQRVIGLFITSLRQNVEMFKALDNVSLYIPSGTCMGFVGHNGSGKSTLLSVIAGIYTPTSGSIHLPEKARIGTMIQLGVGFCPDLTGRENIFLNASLYGLSNDETRAIYQEIVAFSELEHFIDVPVKNYSSGMYARLGFAVTVHLKLDILLVDEILGVGDAAFQEKCFAKMNELKNSGKTIVFVSHDANSVRTFCDSACLLHHGRVLGVGEPAVILNKYDQLMHNRISAAEAERTLAIELGDSSSSYIPRAALHKPEPRTIRRHPLVRMAKQVLKKLLPWEFIENTRIRRLLSENNVLSESWGQTHCPSPATPGFGVNVFGFHSVPFGLGEGASSTCGLLQEAGIPVHKVDFRHEELVETFVKGIIQPVDLPYPVNICQINPQEFGFMVKRFLPDNFRTRYNIGYWVWEQEPVPRSWVLASAYVQEIWTPSSYVANAARQGGIKCPIRVVPHCIRLPEGADFVLPERLRIPQGKRLLVCMFDMSSTSMRKNPLATLQAIVKASAGYEDVCVVVKVRNAWAEPRMMSQIQHLLRNCDHRIIDEVLTKDEIWGILANSAAFVSLHRSEGFGLFLAEAMAVGCPVIATGYSGNMEFMNSENSLPVAYTLVENRHACPPYFKGLRWAEPNTSDAVEKIRWVLDHPEDAKQLGNNGRACINTRFSPAAVGAIVRSLWKA